MVIAIALIGLISLAFGAVVYKKGKWKGPFNTRGRFSPGKGDLWSRWDEPINPRDHPSDWGDEGVPGVGDKEWKSYEHLLGYHDALKNKYNLSKARKQYDMLKKGVIPRDSPKKHGWSDYDRFYEEVDWAMYQGDINYPELNDIGKRMIRENMAYAFKAFVSDVPPYGMTHITRA